jgi:hypothetical protein
MPATSTRRACPGYERLSEDVTQLHADTGCTQ